MLIAGAGIAVSAMVARYGLIEYQKYQVSFLMNSTVVFTSFL